VIATKIKISGLPTAHHILWYINSACNSDCKILIWNRAVSRFTDRQVQAAKPGRTLVTDTTGLYVHVNPDGSRRWVWRYTKLSGRVSEMGLGRYPKVTLAQARDRVGEFERQLRGKNDPVQTKRAERSQAKNGDTRFAGVLKQYVDAKGKTDAIAEMQAILRRHAAPLFAMPIGIIDTHTIARVLAPINAKHPFTARCALRGISKVLRYAKVMRLRATADDADWADVFEHLWAELKPSVHCAALPYAEIPALMATLKRYHSATSLALQMLVLCACRTAEVLGAQWHEVDIAARTYTLPAARMKGRREHVIPLGNAALAVLDQAKALFGDTGYIFKGRGAGALSSRSLERALHVTFKVQNASVHGMRSAFSTFAHEQTEFPHELIELALAHQEGRGNAVARAYNRGTAIERRRALMQAWADFVTGRQAPSNVVPLPVAGRSAI
jgi:integrase